VAQLPQRWREIMLLLTADPPTPYEEISLRLQVPIGSIGPTRRRCLRRLEALLDR
jgi:DNA-directed RNA polymerase specialized sigma24 family protein